MAECLLNTYEALGSIPGTPSNYSYGQECISVVEYILYMHEFALGHLGEKNWCLYLVFLKL